MKRLDIYIGSEFLKSFALALAGLVMLMLLLNVLDQLRFEIKGTPDRIALYLLYSVPQTISVMLPAALMFSVCFTVASFTMSREMIAILSAGISFYRGIATIFASGAVACIGLFFFQNLVVTPANEKASAELALLKKGKSTVKDLVWQKNIRGRQGYYFIYYLDKEKLRIMGGFNYLELSEGRPVRMVQAHGGDYRKESKDWLLTKVRLIEFDKDVQIKSIKELPQRVEKFPDDITLFYAPSADPTEMTLGELWDEIQRRKETGVSSVPYQVQLHANLSFPLMTILVTIVGAIAGSTGNIRSGGPLFKSLLLSIATIVIYQLVFRLGQNLGNNGIVPPPLAAWGPTGIFMAIAGTLVMRNRK